MVWEGVWQFYEIKYEEIVGKPAPISQLSSALMSLRLGAKETDLLLSLFDYFQYAGLEQKWSSHKKTCRATGRANARCRGGAL